MPKFNFRFQDINIATRAWSMVAGMLGVMILVGVFIVVGNIWVTNVLNEIAAEADELHQVSDLGLVLQQVVMPANDYLIIGGDPRERENFKKLSQAAEAALAKAQATIDTPEEEKLFLAIRADFARLKEKAQKLLAIPQAEAYGSAAAGRLMEEIDALADQTTLAVNQWHDIVTSEVGAAQDLFKQTQRTFLPLLIILIALVLAVAILISIVMISTVVNPILHLSKTAEKITGGDLAARAAIDSKDELGKLAVSFNFMTDRLLKAGQYIKGIVEAMPVALIVADQNGKIQTTNKAVCQLMGCAEGPCPYVGANLAKLFPTTTTTTTTTLLETLQLEKLATEGRVSDLRLNFQGAKGEKIPIALSGALLYDENRQATHIILIAKDLRELAVYARRRLAEYTPVLQKAAHGDFSQKIVLPAEEDEFAAHLTVLNLMIEDFRKMVLEIKQKSEEAEIRNAELVHISSDLEASKAILDERGRELKKLNLKLEEEVKKRTQELEDKILELEKFNKLAVDRELKMVDLKEEIARLKGGG